MGFVSSHPCLISEEIESLSWLFFQDPCFLFHIRLLLFIYVNSSLFLIPRHIFRNTQTHSKRKHVLTFDRAIIPFKSIIEYILLHCLCVIYFLIFTGKICERNAFHVIAVNNSYSLHTLSLEQFLLVVLLITTQFQCSCLIDRKLLERSLQFTYYVKGTEECSRIFINVLIK